MRSKGRRAMTGCAVFPILPVLLAMAPPPKPPEGRRVGSEAARVSLTAPPGWAVESPETIRANAESLELADESLRRGNDNLLFKVSKYPEPTERINPAIQVGRLPLPEGTTLGPPELLRALLGPVERSYFDFSYTVPPRRTTVDGRPAAHAVYVFTLKTKDGREYPTVARWWAVPRGSDVILVTMGGPREGPDAAEAEFEAVLRSIRIGEAP